MKQKFLLLFLSISTSVFAQTKENKNNWIIKGNVTSLIDIFTFPTVQLSIEKKISAYFSLTAEAGLQLYDVRHADTNYLNSQGFKVNVECRFYFSSFYHPELTGKTEGFYLGLQPFYRQNQYTAGISYHTKLDSVNWQKDELGVKNTTFGLNCLLGYQEPLSNRLVLDMYVGFGIMKRIVTNTDRQFNRDSGDYLAGTDLVPLFESLNLSESSGRSGNFLLGFRIGYKL
ncbi:MAG: DUF3575 domain-containing protein [Bacteroidia bacterium]